MRGRKPKPTRLKLLCGSRQPINNNEPQYEMQGLQCPEWLAGEARAEWERIIPILTNQGVATVADVACLEAYCVAYARWKFAEREIEKATDEKLFLLSRMARGYLALLKSLCAELGLTPTSRTRVTCSGKQTENKAQVFKF